MSRSNNVKTVNPARIVLRWSSEKKCFKAYNRETKDKFDIKIPFAFIVLDQLQRVTGYNENAGEGIFSNMVKETEAGIFKVKCYKANDFPIIGKWKDIKEKVSSRGGKWAKVIFAMAKTKKDDDFEIMEIELSGAAVSSYINTLKDPYDGAVIVSKTEQGKKGSVTYTYPVFERKDITKDLEEKAKIMDVELQEYINYMTNQDVFDDDDMKSDTTPMYTIPPPSEVPPIEDNTPADPNGATDLDEPTGELPF
jgi:predicted transcriptional regulator